MLDLKNVWKINPKKNYWNSNNLWLWINSQIPTQFKKTELQILQVFYHNLYWQETRWGQSCTNGVPGFELSIWHCYQRFLLECMRLLGLLEDIVSLCGNWLSLKFAYVSCGGNKLNSSHIGCRNSPGIDSSTHSLFNLCLTIVWSCQNDQICRWLLCYKVQLTPVSIASRHEKNLEMIIKWQ